MNTEIEKHTEPKSKIILYCWMGIVLRKELIHRHPLDKDINKYYETVKTIVVPNCMNVASDVPDYSARVEKYFSYTFPAFSDAFNFGVELMFRMAAERSHQTEENITKAQILRAVMDMSFTMSAIMDDCSDGSDYRRGKKCWHLICEGGLGAAIYDGTNMGLFPLHILQKHFKNDKGYILMMELVYKGFLELMIGQTIDVLSHHKGVPDMKQYRYISKYKAGQFTSTGPVLGLLHAGIFNDEMILKTKQISTKFGEMLQTWDDFTDYYVTEKTGKPANDLRNGGNTWASSIAMEKFNQKQKEEFKRCYGSSDAAKLEKVRELYHEIDMPQLYVNELERHYGECKSMIKTVPHEGVRQALSSYTDWLVGVKSSEENCL